MEALILAAGRGRRLGTMAKAVPKCLLRFGGDTLLQRHLDILRHCGVHEVTIAVGYEAEQVMSEIQHLGTPSRVRTLYNPDYARGSMVSLWTARQILTGGADVVLMDANVLYDYRLMERLWAKHMIRAPVSAMAAAAREVRATASVADVEDRIASVGEIFRLQGAEELVQAERR